MTLHVTIDGKDRDAMADLVRRHEVDVLHPTLEQRRGQGYRVHALVDADRVEALRAAGYDVDVLADAEKVTAARRKDIDWHPEDRPRRRRTKA